MPDWGGAFPFATTLDFAPLVEFWRQVAADPESRWFSLAQGILERVEGVPELNGPVDGPQRLGQHQAHVEQLMSAFMSPSGDRLVAAAMVPWSMEPVYETEAARDLGLVERMHDHFRRTYPAAEMSAGLVLKAYGLILQEIYGVEMAFELPFSWIRFRDEESTIPIECPQPGITRRYSLDFVTRFVNIEVVGERPQVTKEEIEPLVGDPHGLPRLMELLPPERFAFDGVTVLLAEDVTAEAALTAIRDDLLLKDALLSFDGIVHLQGHVRAFMDQADLELGLIAFERGDDVNAVIGGRAVGRSLLLAGGQAPVCPRPAESLYARTLEVRKPVFVHDLACCDRTGFERHILALGINALVLQPLFVEDALVGLLELGSPTAGSLSSVNIFKLEKIQGLFALGLRRSMEEQEDRIQAVIKRDYTAIHPVVEWRFREAARHRLQEEPRGELESAEDIVFHDLIPLYGLTDIRNSSSLRNAAIVADLRQQLELAKAVVKTARSAKPQPALDELEYRIARSIESLHPEMATEDETSIFDYLQGHVEPLFESLAELGSDVEEAVAAYRAALDPELGVVYHRRRAFEESVGMVNETVARVLHDQEVHAQSLVPHFFELFKTDGVDHNIYVGDSVLESGAMGPLDLSNLRLWQLMTMCRVAWALDERCDQLPVPLEATHLILVQRTPLSIRFRRDEKRFDVDGAYNIRYEIVKKRIDKAQVLGTGERLTQPGTIAVAYAHEREGTEYRRYLEYLQSAGFVEGGIEALELEDLQGVFGLHAMRVQVRQPGAQADAPDTPTAIEAAAAGVAIEFA